MTHALMIYLGSLPFHFWLPNMIPLPESLWRGVRFLRTFAIISNVVNHWWDKPFLQEIRVAKVFTGQRKWSNWCILRFSYLLARQMPEAWISDHPILLTVNCDDSHSKHSFCYRSGTVNSKSFISKVLLRIKWKFKLN